MTTLNTLIRTLSIGLLLCAPVVAADGDADGERLTRASAREVLEHFVGRWESQGRFVGSDGYTTTVSEESCGRFMLGGKFVECAGLTDGEAGLKIFGFDESDASFFSWSTSAAGKIYRQTGRWDERTRTMTWSTTVRGQPMVSEMLMGPDEISQRATLTDKKSGEVIMSGTLQSRRVSRTSDPKFFESALGAGSTSPVPELQPMQVFVGPWRETLVLEVPGRNSIRGAGTIAARWGLGGTVQFWRGSRETSLGSEEYLWIFTFSDEEHHKAVWFSSQGAVVEYIGGKTPDADVWQWQADGLRRGVQQTITFDATTPSRIESTMTMKGSSGRSITLRSTATKDDSPAN